MHGYFSIGACDLCLYFCFVTFAMYGSAGFSALYYLSCLGYSVMYHCDTQCLSLGSLFFAHLGSIKE